LVEVANCISLTSFLSLTLIQQGTQR